MTENRKTIRLQSYDEVTIEGLQLKKGEILLKDISVTGCRVECLTKAEIKLNIRYRMKIVPENSTKIGAFNIVVESRWIKTNENSFEIGFFIMESPKGDQFQHYVDYLSLRYSKGGSNTGENSALPRMVNTGD